MRDTYWKPNLLCTFPNLHMLFLTANYTQLHHANRGKIKRQLVSFVATMENGDTCTHTHSWHRGMQVGCTWNLMQCIKIKKVGQQKNSASWGLWDDLHFRSPATLKTQHFRRWTWLCRHFVPRRIRLFGGYWGNIILPACIAFPADQILEWRVSDLCTNNSTIRQGLTCLLIKPNRKPIWSKV